MLVRRCDLLPGELEISRCVVRSWSARRSTGLIEWSGRGMLRTRVQRLLHLCIRLRLPMRCGLRLIDGVHSVSGMLRLRALRQVESVRA